MGYNAPWQVIGRKNEIAVEVMLTLKESVPLALIIEIVIYREKAIFLPNLPSYF